jgi:hypothetical protein
MDKNNFSEGGLYSITNSTFVAKEYTLLRSENFFMGPAKSNPQFQTTFLKRSSSLLPS